MPTSALHEVLIDLVRRRPALLADVGLLAPDVELAIAEAGASQAMASLRAADLVLLVGQPPTLALVIEVQLRRDKHKRFTWPLYLAAIAARHRCPAALAVITPEPRVAAWAREPIRFGLGTGEVRPLVIGPDDVPRIVEPDQARRAPEAAVLSALVHGDGDDGLEVLLAAMAGIDALPGPDAVIYDDAVRRRLSKARQLALEVAMDPKKYKFGSEWALRHIAIGKDEGRVEEACRIALRLIVRRCGMLGPDIQERVSALPIEQLERLIDASLDFTTLADLEAWLATA